LSLTSLHSLPLATMPCCLHRPCQLRDLHSFPTRRSSDLALAGIPQKAFCIYVKKLLDLNFKIARAEQFCDEKGNYYRKIVRVYRDRKSTRLNSSHVSISYAVCCLKKKK